MDEIWMPVKDYEGIYSVSNKGRVRREEYTQILPNGAAGTIKSHIMKNVIGSNDYLYVVLCKDNKPKRYSVHRLVATAFIPNPNDLPEVNHIDHDRQNAKVENLEWCDRLYNVRHGDGIAKAAKKKSKAIDRYTMDGQYIDTWQSEVEYCRQHGITGTSLIRKACVESYNMLSAYGYRWRFHGDTTPFGTKKPQGYRVAQYTKDGKLLNVFTSVLSASKETGVERTTIHDCAEGKCLQAGGYIWRYVKDIRQQQKRSDV